MFDKFRLKDVLAHYKQNFVSTQWGNEKIQMGSCEMVSGQLGCERSEFSLKC